MQGSKSVTWRKCVPAGDTVWSDADLSKACIAWAAMSGSHSHSVTLSCTVCWFGGILFAFTRQAVCSLGDPTASGVLEETSVKGLSRKEKGL